MRRRIVTASTTKSILIGVIIIVILSVFYNGMIAALLLNGNIKEDNMYMASNITIFIAVLIGCVVGGKLANGKIGIICVATTASILLLQIGINIIFFDGVFHGFIKNVFNLIAGCSLSCLVLLKRSNHKRRR